MKSKKEFGVQVRFIYSHLKHYMTYITILVFTSLLTSLEQIFNIGMGDFKLGIIYQQFVSK